jgi:hypothetical protein
MLMELNRVNQTMCLKNSSVQSDSEVQVIKQDVVC